MPAVPSKEEWQQARRRSGSPPRNSIYAAVATHWPTANFGGKTQSAAADEYSTPLFSSFGNFKYLNGDGKCQHDETCVTKDMADRTSEVFQAGLQAQPTWQPAGLSMPQTRHIGAGEALSAELRQLSPTTCQQLMDVQTNQEYACEPHRFSQATSFRNQVHAPQAWEGAQASMLPPDLSENVYTRAVPRYASYSALPADRSTPRQKDILADDAFRGHSSYDGLGQAVHVAEEMFNTYDQVCLSDVCYSSELQ